MSDLAPEFNEGGPAKVVDAPADSPAPTPLPVAADNLNDYVFVRFPDGSLRAVPKDQILATNGMGGFESVAAPTIESKEEFYVHLADGSVERVMRRDLPAASGTNAPNGYLIRDSKAYFVTGVYPVETDHVA